MLTDVYEVNVRNNTYVLCYIACVGVWWRARLTDGYIPVDIIEIWRGILARVGPFFSSVGVRTTVL